MWVRKRIDVSATDLISALADSLTPAAACPGRDPTIELHGEIPSRFVPCLSVRTGFDALLDRVDWPAGSEIIMTAISIPDMPRIAAKHGYRVVSVDIDPLSLAPSCEQIRNRLSPKTHGIVLTHLTGGRIPTASVRAICKQHDIMLIEDCAQAFVGRDQMISHSSHSDVSLWSFGPIKTATALGGGLISVQDARLRHRITDQLRNQTQQPKAYFSRRIAKYTLLWTLCHRPLASTVATGFRMLGSDHDQFVAGLARGFSGPDFFARIRHQPSAPLIRMLRRRLQSDVEHSINTRRACGERLSDQLTGVLPIMGSEMINPTYWLFGVLTKDPTSLIDTLWKAGFDATNRSSLSTVAGQLSESPNATRILRDMVLLPIDGRMKLSEIQRMADTIIASGAEPPDWTPKLPSRQKPSPSSSSSFQADVYAC